MSEIPTPGELRPSSLPKFAACRCYRSKPGSSEAAKRGTLVDALMRDMLITGNSPSEVEGLDAEAIEAAKWGVAQILDIAGDAPVIAKEQDLRIDLHREVSPEFVEGRVGTMDALIPLQNTLIDFKTGLVRDYEGQMAAYSLAMMRRSEGDIFEDPIDRYTAHLVFVDARHIVTHTFTKERAEQIVNGIINRPKVPTRCEYCSADWCANFAICPLTEESAAKVVDFAEDMPKPTPYAVAEAKKRNSVPLTLKRLLEDEEAAFDFLDALKTAEKWADVLKSLLKEKLKGGAESRYFYLTKASESKKVLPLALGRYIREFGTDRLLQLFAPIALSSFEKTWQEVMGNKPIPDTLIKVEVGSPSFKTKSTIKK